MILRDSARILSAGVRAALYEAHREEPAPCGSEWCELSRDWKPDTPEALTFPIRISHDFAQLMATPQGWNVNVKKVMLRPYGDGTLTIIFEPADEIDFISNHNVQRTMMAAIDLAEAVDQMTDPLPDEVVTALSEFKRAARKRLGDQREVADDG